MTVKLNNIPETSQKKNSQSLRKYGEHHKKSICLEFHAAITIKAYPDRSPGGLIIR